MKRWEKLILESKTPEEYVDRSFRSGLPPAEKARLARQWMEATGYGKEDILFARNRHPHWKKKKQEGSEGRTRRRLVACSNSPAAAPISGKRIAQGRFWIL